MRLALLLLFAMAVLSILAQSGDREIAATRRVAALGKVTPQLVACGFTIGGPPTANDSSIVMCDTRQSVSTPIGNLP